MFDTTDRILNQLRAGEDGLAEFKALRLGNRGVLSPNTEDLAGELVAFANADGGTIFLGVDDSGAGGADQPSVPAAPFRRGRRGSRQGHPRQRRPHHRRGRAPPRLHRHSPAGRRRRRRAHAPRHPAPAGTRPPPGGGDGVVAPDHGAAEAGGDPRPGAGQPGRGAPGRRAIGAGVAPRRPVRGRTGAPAEPQPERRAAAARRFRPAGPLRREPPVVRPSPHPRRRRRPRAPHRVRQRGHSAAVAGRVTTPRGGVPLRRAVSATRRHVRGPDRRSAERPDTGCSGWPRTR